MREKKIFWLDENKKSMYQGDWERPVTHPSFFLKEKLEWMAEVGVDHMAVVTLSQLYCNGMAKSDAMDVIRFQNDFHLGVQTAHPDKFTTGFVVQPAFLDEALKEMERCVGNGLKMLCLATHYQDKNGEWLTVFNPETDAIFEMANKHELAVQIHPYDAPKVVNLEDEYWRFHLIWMPAMTADAYHFFTLKNYSERYPEMRTCFAHGNIMGQINIGRRRQGFLGRPDKFVGTKDPGKSVGLQNVYFDTLTHDPDGLAFIMKKQGVSQVILGLDDPYPLGEMTGVEDSYPGKALEELQSAGLISKEATKQVCSDNVTNWLFGKEK